MARTRAADACVQSDSIKGLAQSIAKPAYHRLVVVEPALRRAVPTLIIPFLATIFVGAFVQIVDQSRQQFSSLRKEIAALADLISDRLEHVTPSRQNKTVSADRLQSLLPGFTPPWGIANGRHILVANETGRVIARLPEGTSPIAEQATNLITSIDPSTIDASQNSAISVTLANGNSALAALRAIKSSSLQLIVVEEQQDALLPPYAALSITLSATTGFVVLILGFAFHWQSTRAREGDLINDAVRARIDTALNRGRCGLWDWDLSRGRVFWSRSMFELVGLDARRLDHGFPLRAVLPDALGKRVAGLAHVLRVGAEQRGGRRRGAGQQPLPRRRVDQRHLEQLAHHAVRELALQLAPPGGEDGHAGVGRPAAGLGGQPRLADARLALDEHHPGLAAGRPGDDLLDLLSAPSAYP